MTWYASQLITRGTPQVLGHLKSNPLFRDHSFLVTNPVKHHWHRPGIAHSLPSEGLAFVRPICDPNDHISGWHDEEVLSWKRFEDAPEVGLELSPRAVRARLPQVEFTAFPPESVLCTAKKLQQDTGTPVAFFYSFYWGGLPEIEHAWLFDESERVLVTVRDKEVGCLIEIDQMTAEQREGDVLVHVLRWLSCDQPTEFFAPHTRGFPWHEYQI